VNGGDVLLISMPQMGGAPPKLQPALLISVLPSPYETLLICGISTQLHAVQPNWDEVIGPGDTTFRRVICARPP
jgi:hypothetical protein